MSAHKCGFEQSRVSVVGHQLSSSLKPSRPVQRRWEPGSPSSSLKTVEKGTGQGAAGLQQGLERVPVATWIAGGRERDLVLLFPSPLIFLWFINDLSYDSGDINRMPQFQMSPSPLPTPPLLPLSGTLTASFTLIKTNNKLIHPSHQGN